MSDRPDWDSVGRPLMHQFSDRTTTGEAVYVSDMKPRGEYMLSFFGMRKFLGDIRVTLCSCCYFLMHVRLLVKGIKFPEIKCGQDKRRATSPKMVHEEMTSTI